MASTNNTRPKDKQESSQHVLPSIVFGALLLFFFATASIHEMIHQHFLLLENSNSNNLLVNNGGFNNHKNDHKNKQKDLNKTKFGDGKQKKKLRGEKRNIVKPEDVGEHGAPYLQIREEYDKKFPPGDNARLLQFAESARVNKYEPMKDFDPLVNCPDEPIEGYPMQWNVLDVLENWPPDDTAPRSRIYQGICVFDYFTEFHKAKNYREAEVPFVVRNHPEQLAAAERWNDPDYLPRLLPNNQRGEYSENNHFMYWHAGKKAKNTPNWSPPTKNINIKYTEWLDHANASEELLGPDHPHWYYRLISCGAWDSCAPSGSEFIFDELPFFKPTEKSGVFIVEPDKQMGVHCRFGMKGVIAENHFDGSRNMIAVMGGERRYILSHPKECQNMHLLPKEHPSGRHSAVDWSNPDLEQFPKFANLTVNEIVLQAGDILYLPTNWFHYIVSLGTNYQCNTRSGITRETMSHISKCGF